MSRQDFLHLLLFPKHNLSLLVLFLALSLCIFTPSLNLSDCWKWDLLLLFTPNLNFWWCMYLFFSVYAFVFFLFVLFSFTNKLSETILFNEFIHICPLTIILFCFSFCHSSDSVYLSSPSLHSFVCETIFCSNSIISIAWKLFKGWTSFLLFSNLTFHLFNIAHRLLVKTTLRRTTTGQPAFPIY